MTTVPLHRAPARPFSRYKTTSDIRARHRAGTVAEGRSTDIFASIIMGTFIACWIIIFIGVVTVGNETSPVFTAPKHTALPVDKTPSFKSSRFATLDPSILSNMQSSKNNK